MKKVILICPDQRPALEELTGGVPLALAVYMGKPLIEHALDGLARDGFTDVLILVSDRPSDLRAYLGDGSAWGLQIQISPESHELTCEEAAIRYATFAHDRVITLDALPQAPDVPIIEDAASWHHSRSQLLPLLAPGQIGAKEISPMIWLGMKTRIHSSAILRAPCWIGHNAMIGAEAVIGPNAFIESHSVIDDHASMENSTVGPRTYLGSMTHLGESVATGPLLVNWKNGSSTRLSDAFLLSHLNPPREALSSPIGRMIALIVLILTFPFLSIALLRRPWCVTRVAVLPSSPGESIRTVNYHEMPGLPGKLKRWPCLWRVITGHFVWIGNPPLTLGEVSQLENEFERLWLTTGPGIFTAPEAEGCVPPWDDSARAHAALFASQPNAKWKLKILTNGLKQIFK